MMKRLDEIREYNYYFQFTLNSYARKCVISFLDLYSKTKRNLKGMDILSIAKDDMGKLTKNFQK